MLGAYSIRLHSITERARHGPRRNHSTVAPLRSVRACLKLSRLEHALEAHAGHEQRGEHGHVPRGVGARLVVDPQAAVALQAAEGLLDLPAPLLDLEARAVPDPD